MNTLQKYKLRSEYRDVLRYEGEFTDRDGRRYVLHILHKGDAPLETMRLGSSPIVISRDVERMGGVVVSRAVVNALSSRDGLFRSLYKMPEGSVKLIVWCDGEIYWIGALDPENYEEDYNRRHNYMVELTFSDFGYAKRLRHKFSGMRSVKSWIKLFSLKVFAQGRYDVGIEVLPFSRFDEWFKDRSSWAVYSSGDEWEMDFPYKLVDAGMISSRVFYDEEDNSLTIYDSLDRMLKSLGLILEQKNGSLYLYDLDFILSRTGAVLQPKSSDAVFVADESYNAINFSIDKKMERNVVSFEIPKIVNGKKIDYPRIDRPEYIAYSVNLEPIKGVDGCYHVESYPNTLGENDRFVALCFLPVDYKAAILETAYNRVSEQGSYIGEERNGSNDTRRIGNGYVYEYAFSRSVMLSFVNGGNIIYIPAHFGMKKWPRNKTIYPKRLFKPYLSKRETIIKMSIDVPKVSGTVLLFNAKIFVSFQASLYEKANKEFVIDTRLRHPTKTQVKSGSDESVQKLYEGELLSHTRNVLIEARATIGDKYILVSEYEDYTVNYEGRMVYKADGVTRQVLRWESLNDRNKDSTFWIPFGDRDKFSFRSWVSTTDMHVNLGMAQVDSDKGVLAYKKSYYDFENFYGDSFVMPPPPEAGIMSFELLKHVSFDFMHENLIKAISGYYNGSLSSLSDKNKAYRDLVHVYIGGGFYKLLYDEVFAPSYVLLKDVELKISDDFKESGVLLSDKIQKTALLDEFAYEVMELEPMISSDVELNVSSPALIFDGKGRRMSNIYRIDWHDFDDDYDGFFGIDPSISYNNTTEMLASLAFSYYGARKHIIEARFQTVRGINLCEYAGNMYMVISEEEDLRKCMSEYKLAELSRDRYQKTEVALGAHSEAKNGVFIVR